MRQIKRENNTVFALGIGRIKKIKFARMKGRDQED
jgi:hypothetical protein